MQRTMPRYLKVTTTHVSRGGVRTSVVNIGYLYADGECTWELRGPVEALKKDHNV